MRTYSIAGERRRHVREHVEERHVVGVDAVAELRVDAGVEGRRQRRRARHHPQRDVHDVVAQPAAVGEAGHVAAEHAERIRVRASAGSRR